jgi:hypothetical protein
MATNASETAPSGMINVELMRTITAGYSYPDLFINGKFREELELMLGIAIK